MQKKIWSMPPQETHTLLLNQDRQERKASLMERIQSNRQTVGVILLDRGLIIYLR